MPFLEATTIFHRHWPREDPQLAVLLLHGYGEHSGHYRRLAAHLSRAGADVWAPDHVGHGLSGPVRDGRFRSVDRLVENAETVLATAMKTAPHLPLVVVGHSLGGVAAALLAARDPQSVHGLVLTGAPVLGRPAASADAPEPVMSRDPSYLDELEHDPLGFDSAAAEEDLWRCLDHAAADLETARGALTMPTLLIYGQHDAFTPPGKAAEWALSLPDQETVVIPHGHHDIVNDVAHEQVADRIIAFLDRVRSTP